MLTGQASNEAIQKAKDEADLLVCISKPWTEEDLKNVVNDLLEN
jgi:hypothetical protein